MPRLDGPTSYEIKVPGRLDESWSDWVAGMAVHVEGEGGATITTLRGVVTDQAALQGLLNHLYDLGLALISVNVIGAGAGPPEG